MSEKYNLCSACSRALKQGGAEVFQLHIRGKRFVCDRCGRTRRGGTFHVSGPEGGETA